MKSGFLIDEAMNRCVKAHHIHIGNLLAYFFLNCVVDGSQDAAQRAFVNIVASIVVSLFLYVLYCLRFFWGKYHMKLACHWVGHIPVDKNTHFLIQESCWYTLKINV